MKNFSQIGRGEGVLFMGLAPTTTHKATVRFWKHPNNHSPYIVIPLLLFAVITLVGCQTMIPCEDNGLKYSVFLIDCKGTFADFTKTYDPEIKFGLDTAAAKLNAVDIKLSTQVVKLRKDYDDLNNGLQLTYKANCEMCNGDPCYRILRNKVQDDGKIIALRYYDIRQISASILKAADIASDPSKHPADRDKAKEDVAQNITKGKSSIDEGEKTKKKLEEKPTTPTPINPPEKRSQTLEEIRQEQIKTSQLVSDLSVNFAQKTDELTKKVDGLRVVSIMEQPVLRVSFSKASSKLTKRAQDEIEVVLKDKITTTTKLSVVGSADVSGSMRHNVSLSRDRAMAVTGWLILKCGALPSQITTSWIGPCSAMGKPDDNRVVVIYISNLVG